MPQILEADARRRDEVMHDADIGLGGDPNVEMEQMIVILVDRSSQGIFHRYHRRVDLSSAQSHKNGFECRVGNNFGFGTQQLTGRLLAESSQFALNTCALQFHRLIIPRLARA